jgi:hypothetical protein
MTTSRLEQIRSRFPQNGLFAEKTWRIAANAFPFSPKHLEQIQKLGHLLHKFNQACNLLYRQSWQGKKPAWIAELLDRGKPPELIALMRDDKLKTLLPAVIRPDLVLTENGFAITELDSVPGGIGLTAWLAETYTALGDNIVGGPNGMRDGFQQIFPQGDVVISEEAASYRPEMEWLTSPERVKTAESYTANGAPIYRFFEAFDWPNLKTLRESWTPATPMTPPLKPFIEEKLWLALFWMRPLQEFWRQELSERGQRTLQQYIPYSWVLDPTPLPHHAVIPELGIHDWTEMGAFSQKQRDLILKISGFSPLAWGARGVYVGSDMPAHEWQKIIAQALAEFETHPHVLQRFIHGDVYTQDYFDDNGNPVSLKGRARVSPYYFVHQDKVTLGGVLVTLCPADKKLLHGMTDAVISPGSIAAD